LDEKLKGQTSKLRLGDSGYGLERECEDETARFVECYLARLAFVHLKKADLLSGKVTT
jgi:hypothetical protein